MNLFDHADQYPLRAGYKNRTTSRDAANGIEGSGKAATLREAVLHWFQMGNVGTSDDVAHSLGESILSIRPRCTELLALGKIIKTGDRRKMDGNRPGHVLRAA